MKLNLGCGRRLLPGFLNVDIGGGDVQADARTLPFKTEVMDEVLASHVLEHVADLGRVMSEIHRVLKVGGTLRIYVPYGLQSLYNPFHLRPFYFDSMDHFCCHHFASLDCSALYHLKEARVSNYVIPFSYSLAKYGHPLLNPLVEFLKRLSIRLNLYVRAYERMRWRVPLRRRAEITFLLEAI